MPSSQSIKKTSKDAKSLDAETWLNAAFHVLAKNGVEAVRVEPLAKTLGVTKGSFYWHFKDRSALLDAILLSWRQRATLRIIDRLERGGLSASDRLRQLFASTRMHSSTSHDRADVEAAIRLWGRSDAKAASAVDEIDRLRFGYIKGLVEATSDDLNQSAARAMLIYSFMVAEALIGSAIDADICTQCENILFEWSVTKSPVKRGADPKALRAKSSNVRTA